MIFPSLSHSTLWVKAGTCFSSALNKKNQGLFASSPLVLRETAAAGNGCKLIPSWRSQWKLLFWRTVTSNRPDQSLYNQNQWGQCRKNFRGPSKESLMKNKVEVKKPPSHVGSHWSSSEVNWKRGVEEGRMEETGRRVQGCEAKAVEASFRARYPSCPLARLSSGSASHRYCHYHNFQSTF